MMMRYLIMSVFLAAVTVSAWAQTPAGKIYYDLGVFAFEAGDYGTAERYAKQALAATPDNPDYHYLAGKISLKTGNYPQALIHLKTARQAAPDMVGLTSDLGYGFYKISDYDRAASLFAEAVTKDPANVFARYHLGICLFQLERFESALPYFLGVAETSPTADANSRYYAGICYVKSGKYDQALEMFEYARKHSESENLRQSAEKWIQTLTVGQPRERPYFLYLKMNFQYDDNVGLAPPDRDVDQEASEEDDYLVTAFFAAGWDFLKSGDFVLGAGYNHYQSWYFEMDEYNLTASIFRLYSSYQHQRATFSLDYSPSFYWVDAEKFLQSHRIKPAFAYRITDELALGAHYRFTDNNYEDHERDGTAHGLFLNLSWKASRRAQIFAEAGYETVSADYEIYAHDLYDANLMLRLELPWELALRWSARYSQRQYDEAEPTADAAREDDYFSVSASLSRKLGFNWLEVGLMYEYAENQSNIEAYEFKRNLIGCSIAAIY